MANEVLKAFLKNVATGGLNDPIMQGFNMAQARARAAQQAEQFRQQLGLKHRELSLDELIKPQDVRVRAQNAKTAADRYGLANRQFEAEPERTQQKQANVLERLRMQQENSMGRIKANKAADLESFLTATNPEATPEQISAAERAARQRAVQQAYGTSSARGRASGNERLATEQRKMQLMQQGKIFKPGVDVHGQMLNRLSTLLSNRANLISKGEDPGLVNAEISRSIQDIQKLFQGPSQQNATPNAVVPDVVNRAREIHANNPNMSVQEAMDAAERELNMRQ